MCLGSDGGQLLVPPRGRYFNQPYQQLLQSPQCWCHLCSVYLRQAASEYLESRFSSTYSSHMAWLFSHALIHSHSGLTPPEKADLTIFSDIVKKRKWSCNLPRWFSVVKKWALEVSGPKLWNCLSWRAKPKPFLTCRGDVSEDTALEELLLQLKLKLACRKYCGMCQRGSRQGWKCSVGWCALVFPPWSPSLLHLPTWKNTQIIQMTAERRWKRALIHGRCEVGTNVGVTVLEGWARWTAILLVSKRWVRESMLWFFQLAGFLFSEMDFTGLETWIKKRVFISSRQRCVLESWKLFHCCLWEEILAFQVTTWLICSIWFFENFFILPWLKSFWIFPSNHVFVWSH